MKIIYIAHPISGDLETNLVKVALIVQRLNLERMDIVPFAPYLVDCIALDDYIPTHRKRGIRNNREFFERKLIDEVWLYGDHISLGMHSEIALANKHRIPVHSKSDKIDFEQSGIKNKSNSLEYPGH